MRVGSTILNGLLQCEISAAATYRRVANRRRGFLGLSALLEGANDHEDSADLLRSRILALGGEPVRDAGVWGQWIDGIEATAKCVGDVADLDALRQEESQSEGQYVEAMQDVALDGESRRLISTVLLPRIRARRGMVEALDSESNSTPLLNTAGGIF